MLKSALWLFGLIILNTSGVKAQITDSKEIIEILCADSFAGRGYVDSGVNRAANFLDNQMKARQLATFGATYRQRYYLPVNTYPETIHVNTSNGLLQAGKDFIVEAGSTSIQGRFRVEHYWPEDSTSNQLLKQVLRSGQVKDQVLFIHQPLKKANWVIDSCLNHQSCPPMLVFTESTKLTHTVRTVLNEIPILQIPDSIHGNMNWLDINLKNHFIENYPTDNLCGYIEGQRDDSLIVFTAHYDHLGKMGQTAIFPGASDNASGVAMLFRIMDYYVEHKPTFRTVFIFFSGEEAGLLGSEFFTQNPMFPLQKVKKLINIDIMGNAEKGLVMVNGEEFPVLFNEMDMLNQEHRFVPYLRKRGKARNSDHYYFSESGVPAVFLYAEGGPGYYHDIFDKPSTLALNNFEAISQWLILFSSSYYKKGKLKYPKLKFR